MKLVINKCYGGFSLSLEAIRAYAKAKGETLYFYHRTKYKHEGGVDECERMDEVGDITDSFMTYKLLDDVGKRVGGDALYQARWLHDRDISRDDKDLVGVVEELGSERASGKFAQLEIVEIPDGANWELEEYDGIEWVSESHQRWG
jgi:hypothetical protein